MAITAEGSLPFIQYPRRQFIRSLLRGLIAIGLGALCNMKVEGLENFPRTGPVLMVGNHFSFLDPVAVIRFSPRHVEFIGGTQTPNAPKAVGWISKVYGVLPVRRGSLTLPTSWRASPGRPPSSSSSPIPTTSGARPPACAGPSPNAGAPSGSTACPSSRFPSKTRWPFAPRTWTRRTPPPSRARRPDPTSTPPPPRDRRPRRRSRPPRSRW